MTEYTRFLRFTNVLNEKLRKDIPRAVLIKSLSRDLNKLTDLSQMEKELFSSPQRVAELLKNPLLEIVMSMKELEAFEA